MARADLMIALRTRLLEDAELKDLVGSRIYPDVTPQGKCLPAIVYQELPGRRDQTIDGPSSLRHARVQYDCLSNAREEATRIGHAIERILDGFTGLLTETRDGQSVSMDIDDCSLDNAYDAVDPAAKGESNPRRRRTIDFDISHQHDAIEPTEE